MNPGELFPGMQWKDAQGADWLVVRRRIEHPAGDRDALTFTVELVRAGSDYDLRTVFTTDPKGA